MDTLITRYKKIILSTLVVVAMSLNTLAFAGCSACQAAAAARKSKQEALAAALATGKSVSHEMELDAVDFADKRVIEACCEYCLQYGVNCGGEFSDRCNACQAAKQSQQDALAAALAIAAAATKKVSKKIQLDMNLERAPRESLEGPCDICPQTCTDLCLLNQQLEALAECCANVNKQVKHQEREAKHCCKKIKHEIHEVEELVESVIDQTAECCSVTEELLVSIIDQTADCCSLSEVFLISIIDTSVDCCSVIETALGDPVTSIALPTPPCGLDISIVDIVNNLDLDTISWLKSLYVLLYNVFSCTCCQFN